MSFFISLLPAIVLIVGLGICILTIFIMDEVLCLDDKLILAIVSILLLLTILCTAITVEYRSKYLSKKDESEYAEIENLVQCGYVVYINGSAIDSNKIIISDYPVDKIHINDECKEIYIGSGN